MVLRGDGVDEDVDRDCPLPMRGAFVMTMAMISPSGRDVSMAEQLCESPRLVPPRFCLMAAEFRPRRWLMIFSHRKSPYSKTSPMSSGTNVTTHKSYSCS